MISASLTCSAVTGCRQSHRHPGCPIALELTKITSLPPALLAKLIEQAQEASHATADDLPGELADVLELLRALTVTAGIAWPQLLALPDDERSRRGSFGSRVFLESVE